MADVLLLRGAPAAGKSTTAAALSRGGEMSEPTRIDVEIERVMAAARRAEAQLEALRGEARGGCCPSCVLGERYTAPADAQERRLSWLTILLEKRGDEPDLERARAIRMSAWP